MNNPNKITYHYNDGRSFPDRHSMIQSILVGESGRADYFTLESFNGVENFTRNCAVNLDEECKLFLTELRQKHDKLALYYSGGLDSHFILTQMIKHGIFPDKIVSQFDETFVEKLAFTTANEQKYSWRRLVKYVEDGIIPSHVKLEKLIITPEMASAYFKDSRFWHLACATRNGIGTFRSNLVNVMFGIDSDYMLLYGQSSPVVYYDGGWKVSYIDLTLDDNWASSNLVSFNANNKRSMEAHVNAIINELEKLPDYKTRFTMEQVLRLPTRHVFRDMIPQYKEASKDLEYAFFFPKINIQEFEIEDTIDRIHASHLRSYFGYLQAQVYKPQWYTDYLEVVRPMVDYMEANLNAGGILMKPIPVV